MLKIGRHPNGIKITTIEDIIYMGMKNDVSIQLYNVMSIYEQQSTYNPNMPVRHLMYAGRLYDKYILENRLNVYGERLVRLPVPKLVTFYNGYRELDDRVLQRSDAFAKDGNEAGPDIDVRVRMVNINYGQGGLLKQCKPLEEYAWLVDRIREYGRRYELEEAIDRAIDEMPGDYEIKGILMANRAEVKNMCLTEYDEEQTMEMFYEQGKEEGRLEGKEEGIQEGWMKAVLEMVQEGYIDSGHAAEKLDKTMDEVEQLIQALEEAVNTGEDRKEA